MRVAVVNVYSKILEETSKQVMITDDTGVRYLGALCIPDKKWVDEEVKELLVESECSLGEVIDKYIQLAKDAGIKVYDSTEKTMRWWGYLNGLFPEYKL